MQISAVVSQPGKPRGRGNKSTPLPTPVEAAARDLLGLPDDRVLCPRSAREVWEVWEVWVREITCERWRRCA